MINLLFSGNEKVFDGVLSCMLSIFKRTKTKEPFRIFVYTMDVTRMKPEYTAISEKMITFLDKVAKQYNSNNSVIRVDVTALYEKEFAHCPNEDAYCSPYTLLRLLADLVPDMPEKFFIWMWTSSLIEISVYCMTRMYQMWNMRRRGTTTVNI